MHGMSGIGWASLLLLAVAGCGAGPVEGSATDDGTGTSDGSNTQAETAGPTTTGVSDSQEPTTSGASQGSQSGSSSSGEPTTLTTQSATGTTDTTDGTTMDLTASASGETTDGTMNGTTDGTSTDGESSTGSESSTGGESSTGAECEPSPEVCNDVDDDCDGNIDNVDVGKDGICDCLSIALVGNQGNNPSAEFQTWLEDQGTQVDRISQNANEVLDGPTLAKYDIVILDFLVRSYTPAEQLAVQTWVEAGGGLMSMTGYANVQYVADRPNSLIQPMGLAYNTSAGFFNGPVVNFVPHPITQGLTSISFYGGLFVDIVEDGVGINKTIMTLPKGPVGVVQDRGEGRLFIFGDEWIEFDSEWKNIPQIKQFWVQTLAFLGPKKSCQIPQ